MCILTGLNRPSQNPKTGPMLQTWILRADKPPTEAVTDGSDVAICGDCPLRGSFKTRKCYVNVPQGPQAVWKAWKRGAYQSLDPVMTYNRGALGEFARDAMLRIGSYGDPAAVPSLVWVGEEKGAKEVQCPASEEGGKRTTCYRCGLCDGGSKGRSVSIEAHGAFVKRNWKGE